MSAYHSCLPSKNILPYAAEAVNAKSLSSKTTKSCAKVILIDIDPRRDPRAEKTGRIRWNGEHLRVRKSRGKPALFFRKSAEDVPIESSERVNEHSAVRGSGTTETTPPLAALAQAQHLYDKRAYWGSPQSPMPPAGGNFSAELPECECKNRVRPYCQTRSQRTALKRFRQHCQKR